MWLADIDPSALGGSSLVGVLMLALWIVYTQTKNQQATVATKSDTAKFEKIVMVLESLVKQVKELEAKQTEAAARQAETEHQDSKRAAVGDVILKSMADEQRRTNDILERQLILLERTDVKLTQLQQTHKAGG